MNLKLNKMTTEDKIRAMELLWNDLCGQSDKIASPEWHKKVLSAREKAIAKGKDKFNNWNSEKERIRRAVK